MKCLRGAPWGLIYGPVFGPGADASLGVHLVTRATTLDASLAEGCGLPRGEKNQMNSEPDNTRAAKFVVDAHSEQIDVSR